jgi:pyruvate formate lyase activating enzyme
MQIELNQGRESSDQSHENLVHGNRGLIFLIQGYSLHDGPGIRTTVFTKGCPLVCPWCQNPESWKPFPELMAHDEKCIRCGKCIDACPVDAVYVDTETDLRTIDRKLCNRCFACIVVCPAAALTRIGEYMSVEQVLAEIEKDELFHFNSGGGVTISGGEPLLQADFTIALLKACKQRGWNTALDTSGFAPWSMMEAALAHADLLLFDIKHLDPVAHEQATGRKNTLILENLRKVPSTVRIWLRIPLIPGFNDADENLEEVVRLGKQVGAEKVSILPFNRYGEGKHENIGEIRPYENIEPHSRKRINAIKDQIGKQGMKVTIGD